MGVLQAAESSAPRDLFLNSRDIDNISVKSHEAAWKLDKEQAQSIRLFTERFPDSVLYYQEQALLPGDSLKMASLRESCRSCYLSTEERVPQSVSNKRNVTCQTREKGSAMIMIWMNV